MLVAVLGALATYGGLLLPSYSDEPLAYEEDASKLWETANRRTAVSDPPRYGSEAFSYDTTVTEVFGTPAFGRGDFAERILSGYSIYNLLAARSLLSYSRDGVTRYVEPTEAVLVRDGVAVNDGVHAFSLTQLNSGNYTTPLGTGGAKTKNNAASFDTITGVGWTGKGSTNNWTDAGNWAGTAPNTSGTGDRNLFYGNAWRDAGGNGFATSNNNLTGWVGYRITFQDNGFGNAATSFILQGNSITLADFGGNSPLVENDSFLTQTLNFDITFKTSTGTAFINENRGTTTFGGNVTLSNASGAFQMNLQGNSGEQLNFNGAVANGGQRIAITGDENVTFAGGLSGTGDFLKQGAGTATFKTTASSFGGTNNVFIDNGTISVATGGSLGTTNGSTTGLVNMGSTSASQSANNTTLNVANSGITLGNPIDSRYLTGQTNGTKTITGTFGSGSSTLSGNVTLHDSLTISQNSGGTSVFSGVIATASSGTNTANVLFNSGPGVILTGAGTVEYDNTNTYAGETYIKSGTLQFNNGSANSSTIRVGDDVNASTATVNLASATTVGSTINVRLGGGGTKTVSATNSAGTATYSGHIALDSSATFTSTNAGATLAITQGRSTAGGTTAGFDIKNFTATFSGAGNFAIGPAAPTGFGTIYDSTSGASGTGIIMNGTGSLSLNDANSYRGKTQVNSGTLFVGANNALGSSNGTIGTTGSSVLLGNSSGSSNASLLTTGAFTVANAITLQSGNTGTMTLGGNSANASVYSGAVNFGTASGTAKGATFVALAGGSVDFQGVIDENTSVPASSVVIGDASHAGTVKFSNTANGYGGTTSVTNGATLEVVSLGTTGNSSIGNSTRSNSANLLLSNGTLKYSGSGESTSRSFSFDGNGGALDASGLNAVTFTGTASATGTGNRTLTLTGSSTATNVLQSVIGDPSSGTTALSKTGAGTWALSGANTYTGGTSVNNGILQLSGSGTLGSTSGTLTMNGGILDLNGTNQTVGQLTGSGGTILNELPSGGNGPKTLTIGNGVSSGTTSTFSGTITDHDGNGSGFVKLVKTGAGTQAMTSTTSNYTGGTDINGGVLLSNSSNGGALGRGAVNVNNTGTLGGSGIIDAAVTVNNGGTLMPGATANAGSIAKLQTGTSSNGTLTLATGSSFTVDLSGGTTIAGNGAGTLYDQVSVMGNVSVSGALSLNIVTTLSPNDKFYIVLSNGTEAGQFSNTSMLTPTTATYSQSGYTFLVNYADTGDTTALDDISLTVTAVPEPATWAAAALALSLIASRLIVSRRQRSGPRL